MADTTDLKRELIREWNDSIEEAGLDSPESTNGRVNPDERRTLTPEEEEAWEAVRKTGDPYV